MKTMTMQEAFDTVAIHLLTQQDKSQFMDACLYRSPDGLMCSIGCLIDEEDYNENLEDVPTDTLLVRYLEHDDPLPIPWIEDLEIPEMFTFYRWLQNIHDYNSVENWRYLLVEFANEHQLKLDSVINTRNKNDQKEEEA